jgi:hypothetical protein
MMLNKHIDFGVPALLKVLAYWAQAVAQTWRSSYGCNACPGSIAGPQMSHDRSQTRIYGKLMDSRKKHRTWTQIFLWTICLRLQMDFLRPPPCL